MMSEDSDVEIEFHSTGSSRRHNGNNYSSESDDDNTSLPDDEDGKAVLLVKIERSLDNEEHLKLNLNSQYLNAFLESCGDRRLCIISVVGTIRSGKSFLLNCIKERLDAAENGGQTARNVTYKGFLFKSGYSGVTKGLWIWSKPFFVDGEDDEQIAVLLMDAEGISDEFSKPDEIAAILGLSLLSSSILIVNLSGDFSRPPFDWLSTFIGKGDKQQQFQKLSFLIRDWTKLSTSRYGDKGGKRLLEKFVSQNISRCGKVLGAFEETECFLLPHIGEKALHESFAGQSTDLNKEFLNYLKRYTSHVTDTSNLSVKKILDVEITGKEFQHFFAEYVNFFNNPAEMEFGPKPESIALLRRETAGKIKINRGLDEYQKTFKNRSSNSAGTFLRESTLNTLHLQARKKSLQAFKAFELPVELEKRFEQKFDQELKKLIELAKLENENARKTKIEDCISRAAARLREELENNFPFTSNSDTNKIPENLIFYEDDHLEGVLRVAKQEAEREFFDEFLDEGEEELEVLANLLNRTLGPIGREYQNKNTENWERSTEKAKDFVEKFVNGYVESMQKKIRKLPKIDEATLLVFHEMEIEKIENKFEQSVLGTLEFQKMWKDNLLERTEEEFDTMKLSLESTMAEALGLIKETSVEYEKTLNEVANTLEEDDLVQLHELSKESILRKFSPQNPYPKENPKYDEVESKLKRKLQETYEKVVEDGILRRRKLEEKLQQALDYLMGSLKAEVESSVEDQNFLDKDDSTQLLQSSEEKVLHQFDAEVLRIGTAEEKVVEEKAIFLKKVRDYLGAWERKNNEKRAKATTEAEQIVQNCTKLYESEMTKSLKNFHTKEDLLQEHERVKLFAVEQFQADCTTKNSLLVAECIQKIEQRVDEMSQEIREHFDMIQKSNEMGLLAALFDAKSFYSEKMDQSFKNNKSGFFDAKEFQRMGDQAHQATLKSISGEHKLNQNQKKKLDVQLQNLFHKYKQQNAAIKGSYNDKEVALGIDLGTTYCCVAAYHMGKVKIIRNAMGNNITPSYVTINKDGTKVVGDTAKKQAFQNPESTVFDAKRMIGRPMNDKKLQEDMKLWTFTVEEKDGKPQIRVHDKHYHPEQISAMILKHLKDEAEDLLKVTVKKAVITVPAYFTDGQRQATIDAGELAGLQVLGILNEPTAAAVAYRLEWKNLGKARNILVYDLGGGTFDVAILRIDDNKMDVLTVNGDSHLGGEDFDRNMMLHCAQAFRTKNGVDLLRGKDSQVKKERDEARRNLKRLQLNCEDAKKALSTAPVAVITVDEIVRGHDLGVDVKRKEFEDMNAAMFQTTIRIVEEALKSARLKKEDIDDVVLVGGSTRIKRVQQLLENYFDGKALNKEVNPDEAVAYGAAVQAAILNANPGAKLFDFGVIQEVTPMSLGIELASREMDIIIPKNTKIPVSRNEEYRTFRDRQTSASIRIYQGEEQMAADNRLLGTFVLNGIPPGPAGAEVVDVTMHINQNGILNVEAVCRSTKGRNSITVSEDKGRLNKEEKKRLRDEYN